MNMMDLVVYLFINSPVLKPVLKKVDKLNDRQFDKLMQERKLLIPVWMKAMLKAK